MLAIVDYGFIVAFFVILFCFILLIAKPPSKVPATQKVKKTNLARKHMLEYGIIVGLIGFFLLLTVLLERGRSRPSSS
jgi:hypothetical protein